MFIRAALNLIVILAALGCSIAANAQAKTLPQEIKTVISQTAPSGTISAIRETADFAHYRLSLANGADISEALTSTLTQKFGAPSRATPSATHWSIGKDEQGQQSTAILLARNSGYLNVIIDARRSAGANNPRQFKLTARANGKPVKVIQRSTAAEISPPSPALRD